MAKLKARLSKLQPSTRAKLDTSKHAAPIYSDPRYIAWRDEGRRECRRHCQDEQHRGPNPWPGVLYADHIVELKDGGDPFDPKNRCMRCASCHSRKTAAARATRHGVQANPLISRRG
jgi:hypothetical protein